MARKRKDDAAFTAEDDALLSELGIEEETREERTYNAKQERIIAGFEEIVRFVCEHDRLPQHGEDRDIFERLYAVRLDRIVAEPEYVELLRPFDEESILDERRGGEGYEGLDENVSDDELLDALGVGAGDDVSELKHVRSAAERALERSSPDEVAQRKPCEDFEEFRPLVEAVQADLASGRQITHPFKFSRRTKIATGDWFILDGQKAFVAHAGERFQAEHGRWDRRLRVIFDNGTESDLLSRSFRRAMNKDENSRRIVPPQPTTEEDYSEVGSLFADAIETGDAESGTIYVARSLSDDPFVRERRDVLHKIGVTGGDVKARIAGARKDPTFLLAEAELVASYRLANVNRKALEGLLHRFFAAARLDVALADRFGEKVQPREWFLVPLPAVAEVVKRIQDGTIVDAYYDVETAKILSRDRNS